MIEIQFTIRFPELMQAATVLAQAIHRAPEKPVERTADTPATVEQNKPAPAMSAAHEPAAPATPIQAAVVPTTTPQVPTYTMDELAHAGAALMADSTKAPAVMALLSRFGVKSLRDLPPEQYGELATALRELGGVI